MSARALRRLAAALAQRDKAIEALKLALHALEVWKLMQPNTTACAIRIPAIAAIKTVLQLQVDRLEV